MILSAPTSLSPAATLRLPLLNAPLGKALGRLPIPAQLTPMARKQAEPPRHQHLKPLHLPPLARPPIPRRAPVQRESVKLVELWCLVCLRLGLCVCSHARLASRGAHRKCGNVEMRIRNCMNRRTCLRHRKRFLKMVGTATARKDFPDIVSIRVHLH